MMQERMVCGHGSTRPAPCGGDWCLEDSGHATPHTGQKVRCACQEPMALAGEYYRRERDRYVASGAPDALEAMLVHVRSDTGATDRASASQKIEIIPLRPMLVLDRRGRGATEECRGRR